MSVNKDLEHLRWLSIFHFVGAGISLLFVGFTLLQFVVMYYEVNRTLGESPNAINEMMTFVFMFGGIYIAIEIIRLIATVLAGFFIKSRKHRIFCMVVAGVNCAFIPIGTVLGVFTLVILFRDSVKELFHENLQK